MKRHSGISSTTFIYFQMELLDVPIDKITESNINKYVLAKIGRTSIEDLSGEFLFDFKVEKKLVEFKCKWTRITTPNF